MTINRPIQLAVLVMLLTWTYCQWTSQPATAATTPPLPQYEIFVLSPVHFPVTLMPGNEPFAISDGALYVRRRVN